MRIAIFSDIHGNMEALKSIIDDIKKQNIDEIICLGDTIGIGPNPKECMDLIIKNNIKMVLGNHEYYYIKGSHIDDELTDGEIRHHNWVKSLLSDEQREFLLNCCLTIEKEVNGKRILFEHFLINYDSKDQYPFYGFNIIKDESIKSIVNGLNYDLIFVGHEHKDFVVNNKLYDVGSSGCRKDNMTRYTILDTDTFNVETKIIEFDREKFIEEFMRNNYPDKRVVSRWFFGIKL